MTQYADFEGIMLQLVREQGWEFEYEGRSVPSPAVFNDATFAPGLLHAAQSELHARGIAQDLGVLIETDSTAMFGKRVRFDEGRNGLLASMWRILQCAYQVEALPRNGHRICLDLVPAALALTSEPAPVPASVK